MLTGPASGILVLMVSAGNRPVSLVDRLGGPHALGAAAAQAAMRASADPELGISAVDLVLSASAEARLEFLTAALADGGAPAAAGLDPFHARRLALHLADSLSLLGVSPTLTSEVQARVVAALADSADGPGRDVALRRAR